MSSICLDLVCHVLSVLYECEACEWSYFFQMQYISIGKGPANADICNTPGIEKRPIGRVKNGHDCGKRKVPRSSRVDFAGLTSASG
jgi:hypothetical protein